MRLWAWPSFFLFFLKKYFIRFRTHNPSAERGHEARQVPQGQQCVNDDLVPSQIGTRPQGYRVAADGAAAPAFWDQAILGTHVVRWEGEKKKKKKKKKRLIFNQDGGCRICAQLPWERVVCV
jgi:hypothetical protein